MNQPACYCYEFGPFHLNPVEQLLTRDGKAALLPPKVFDLLLLLVRNHGHLLAKEELISFIWPDMIVEEGNLTRYISTLRQALGERRGGQQYISTVPRRGYRFVARVKEFWDEGDDQAGAAPPKPAVRSLAVLPFKSLLAPGRDEALELGLADTLIASLSGLGQMLVKPISAVRQYTRLDQDAVAAGRELSVEAVLDGSIQRSGERIRVTMRLMSVPGGATLWVGQFDEQFTDIFKVQDAIAARVLVSLAAQFGGAETRPLAPPYARRADADSGRKSGNDGRAAERGAKVLRCQ